MTGSVPLHLSLEQTTVPRPEGEDAPSRLAAASRVVLVGTWVLVAVFHLSLGPDQRRLTWPLAYLLLEALATASLAYRAWRTPGKSRTAWWLLAASAFLEVPNLAFNTLEMRGRLPGWAEHAQSYLSLGTGLLALAAILSFPMGRDRGLRFRRRALDGLIFAASLLFLLWVMGIQGSLRTAGHGVGLRVFSGYLNAALLGGGLVFMTSYHPDCIRGPLGWLGASVLAWLAGLSCWTLSGLPAVVATEGWMLFAGAIPLFQGLAAWSPKSVEEIIVEVDFERSSGLLAYLPVVLAVLALAALLAWAPQQVTRGAYALFLAMVVLLLLRQFQAIQDLRAARSTLEARVQQRTKALEQAQDTLIRTERMNTLALMGAGLAHDLNNLLCAVKSSADLALLNLEDGLPPGAEDLTRISGAADRAALLTRRLMEFARREAEALAPVELGREIHGMEETLRLLLPRSVDLRIQVGPEPMMVWSSRLRLEQMLVNLVANAGDAMPKGGTLRVKVARCGEQALIEVADSGVGMSPEVLARIFDPFFTTKAPGKGTGLGLSSLKAMVEEGNGRLEVESELARGSRFRLLIPLVHAEALSPR